MFNSRDSFLDSISHSEDANGSSELQQETFFFAFKQLPVLSPSPQVEESWLSVEEESA